MFTGIVGGVAEVQWSETTAQRGRLGVAAVPYLTADLQLGASVAVNGVCLTVVDTDEEIVAFDTVAPTIAATTITRLGVGDVVNLERSVGYGEEVGGHEVSGHVDCVAIVDAVEEHGDGVARLWIEPPPAVMPYVFAKGFIAIDGASLTVSERDDDGFGVWIIPETRRSTRMSSVAAGTPVNLELHKGVQVVVDTIRRGLIELARTGTSPLQLDEQAAIRRLLQLPAAAPWDGRPDQLPAGDAAETP